MILWNPKIQLYKDTPIFPNPQTVAADIFSEFSKRENGAVVAETSILQTDPFVRGI